MKKAITILLIIIGAISLGAQSQSNYYYNRDVLNPPVDNTGWPCGERSFTATSDILIYVPPDAWILELHGTEEATTLTTARNNLQNRINAFQKKLGTMGIAPDAITVTTVSQEKISGYTTNEKGVLVWGVTGYSLTKSIVIKYGSSQMYNQIISAAAEQSLDNVQQHYCTVADEQAVYAELYRHAMEVCMEKREETARFYNSIANPNWSVIAEQYYVITPSPGVYTQPGGPREVHTGYDRVIGAEYGQNAVRYTLHLSINYILTKPQRNNSPVRNK
jgi:uncharacterized protein YggE